MKRNIELTDLYIVGAAIIMAHWTVLGALLFLSIGPSWLIRATK